MKTLTIAAEISCTLYPGTFTEEIAREQLPAWLGEIVSPLVAGFGAPELDATLKSSNGKLVLTLQVADDADPALAAMFAGREFDISAGPIATGLLAVAFPGGVSAKAQLRVGVVEAA